MADIKASDVAKLRSMTNAGMMDCKKALTEANGDLDAAVEIIRKKDANIAVKKAGREANEGIVAQNIQPGGKVGVLVEINCETDFVAKNETFQAFCAEVAKKLAANPDEDLEEFRTLQVAKIGENIQIARKTRMVVEGGGLVAAYIHPGAKVGVLIEVGAGKEDSADSEDFKQLVRDLTLQIAAANPAAVSRDEVDGEAIEKEKAIIAEQFKDKPAQAIEKITQGKLEKYYQTHCLLDQAFVKDGDFCIKDLLANTGKALDDELSVRSFVRYQVGE
jgi:elongation factor Ts